MGKTMIKIKSPTSLSASEIMENYWKKPIDVKHAELSRADDSAFRSVCPVCEEGTLFMMRESESPFNLRLQDNCSLCGTRFNYVDVVPGVTVTYKTEKQSAAPEWLWWFIGIGILTAFALLIWK